jgi:predicted dehydrogenase
MGSAGRRHLANARALGCEAAGGRLPEAEAFAPDAIVVASPTSAHLDALGWAVERGVHALVEKPLASSTDGVADALAAAEAGGLTVGVGYNLRFHPALEAIRASVAAGRIGRLVSARAEAGQHLSEWHPHEDYRRSYAARADLGGGALLTLSHELDYVRWIAGEVESVTGVAAHASSLEIDVDDVVELVCRHSNGAISSIHMDYLDRVYNRRCRWIGEDGTIAWEWGAPARLEPMGETVWDDPAFDLTTTYTAVLADFLDAIARARAPRCTGRDALRVLELCEAVSGGRVAR